jgi:hypothetical protein
MLGVTIPKFIKGTIFHAYCLDEEEPMIYSTKEQTVDTPSESNTMMQESNAMMDEPKKMIHELPRQSSMQKMAV